MSLAGLGPESDCAGEDQQQLEMRDLSSHQRGTYFIVLGMYYCMFAFYCIVLFTFYCIVLYYCIVLLCRFCLY
jgi:hypothetical protein